jgi:hypothetical protein
MNAAASSLIDAIKISFGASAGEAGQPAIGSTGNDWDYVPSGGTNTSPPAPAHIPGGIGKSWYKYGSGGVSSWGTLCGVPNGAVAVLNLMNLNSTTWVDQIMWYYCLTPFPISLDSLWTADPTIYDYVSNPTGGWVFQPVPDAEVLAHTTAHSPLCHVSVSKWAFAAGVSMAATDSYGSGHKTDRCAKVASAMAAFTADLINDGITTGFAMPADAATCYGCHYTGSVPAQQGKMECLECHTNNTPHPPKS